MTLRVAAGWAGLALAVGCTAREPPAPAPASSPVDRAWRHGPRDSALASAVACELLGKLDDPGRGCVVVGYRETATEYVLRLRELDRAKVATAGGARLEVRLTKDGDSATVKHLAVP